MTAPELRITDAEVAAFRLGDPCDRCHGLGGYVVFGGWACCDDCGGDGAFNVGEIRRLPGATARLGAILLAAMPHLRHAVWPPRRERAGRGVLGTAIGLCMMGGGR
jgi:hypothetical protein